MAAEQSYRDGVVGRSLPAVLVALVPALVLYWLDGDVTASVLVAVVTALCVALVPSPKERVGPR